MKTIDDALEIRRRVLGALEMAKTAVDPEERDTWMTMVIVGAGPTGVELAGQIRELAVRSLKRLPPDRPDQGAGRARRRGRRAVGHVRGRLSVKAARSLERMGVELMMGARVTAVDGTGVDVTSKDEAERRGPRTSPPTPSSGRRACRRRRWERCWRRPPAPSWIGPGGSWCSPTSPSRAIPRCSSWGTSSPWTTCPASPRWPCRRAARGQLHAAPAPGQPGPRRCRSATGTWAASPPSAGSGR